MELNSKKREEWALGASRTSSFFFFLGGAAHFHVPSLSSSLNLIASICKRLDGRLGLPQLDARAQKDTKKIQKQFKWRCSLGPLVVLAQPFHGQPHLLLSQRLVRPSSTHVRCALRCFVPMAGTGLSQWHCQGLVQAVKGQLKRLRQGLRYRLGPHAA